MELRKEKDEKQRNLPKAQDEAQQEQDWELEARLEATRVLPPPIHPTLATIDHQHYYAWPPHTLARVEGVAFIAEHTAGYEGIFGPTLPDFYFPYQ